MTPIEAFRAAFLRHSRLLCIACGAGRNQFHDEFSHIAYFRKHGKPPLQFALTPPMHHMGCGFRPRLPL